jgi:predicted permease
MNRAQKISLTLVITISLGLFLGIILIVMRLFDVDISKTAFLFPVFIAGSGGIISITCFKKDKGTITHDERDKLIEKNAHLAGFGAVYLFVILASFLPIGILGEKGSIPVTWCPVLLIGAGFCQAYAQSIAILIQYGWRNKDGGQ